MAKSGVTVTVDRLASIQKSIEALGTTRVMVGVPAAEAGRKVDAGSEPINNAALAYIHENGAPEANIPARPFMGPGIATAQGGINEQLKAAGRAALDGNADAADKRLNATGLVAQNAIRAKINEGVPPPLAESTIAARLRRGRTGDKPLIDTGALRNSITYVIRRGVK